jgi:hypothetical protein
MPWFFRTSRNGIHVVYSQKAEASCGIACIIMVNFKLKKWQLAAAASAVPAAGLAAAPSAAVAFAGAVKSEEEVDAAYTKVSGHPYKGATYTYAQVLPKVLNQLGIGRWEAKCLHSDALAGAILDRAPMGYPFIALVHWRDDGSGHFVVCDNVVVRPSGASADFCDPWDAAVRTLPLTRDEEIVYQAQDQPGVDLGQAHHKYSAASTADMDGWIVYRAGA